MGHLDRFYTVNGQEPAGGAIQFVDINSRLLAAKLD
jgi:hypothetical protein